TCSCAPTTTSAWRCRVTWPTDWRDRNDNRIAASAMDRFAKRSIARRFAVPLFAFIFASPFGAVVAAAGAVSVPIIIHLLNRRRFRIVTWAAMRFLLTAERKNSRRMRLEQLLLLVARCLLVLLIILAMASIMGWAE